jgi:hypothetical protein
MDHLVAIVDEPEAPQEIDLDKLAGHLAAPFAEWDYLAGCGKTQPVSTNLGH